MTMNRKILIVVLASVAILNVQSAMAWGNWGHHIITYLAEKHLTPEAKEKCQHYLKYRLPHYSSWMDYWRHSDPFKESSYWHSSYVDENYKVVGYKGDISRDAAYQVERIVKEMENGKYHNLSDSLVAVNLKLLIHLVPDMHCPCHIGYPKGFTTARLKEMGLQGTSLKVKGKKCSRHKFWDGSPQYMHPKWKADKFITAYDTYTPKQIKKICKGTPLKWSSQNAKRMVKTLGIWDQGDEFRDFSKEQRQQIDDIVHEQVALGGYRLASVLNRIFSK